jgi:hypothetical protein
MAKREEAREERGFLHRLLELGEQRLSALADEVLSNPKFGELLGNALQRAMETKGRVDRNLQAILSVLNLPSKADYRKLAAKIEALQGSLVNLNIKLDKLLARTEKRTTRKSSRKAEESSAAPETPLPSGEDSSGH